MKEHSRSSERVIEEVSSYISRNAEVELPKEVIEKAKHHILDTLAAIVSGSSLKPGKVAKEYAKNLLGVEESQVICSRILTSATNAALVNGVMAHADETDDHHIPSRTHPGCVIVPAALSMSQREEADGLSFIKGVVVGYDIGCRIIQALGGVDTVRQLSRDTHAIGGSFGAAAAAAGIARLKDDFVRYVLSYTAQQASGIYYWARDDEHIEKAFVFGGMPARNGVTAVTLVQSGFTGVRDPFSGEDNFFKAFSPSPHPELLVEGLGSSYEIMVTNLKKFPVGGPIQPALDGLLTLIRKHRLRSKDIKSVVVRLPGVAARVVNNRTMPDINLQHILSVALIDGELTFESAHSHERMREPAVLESRKRIKLLEDRELDDAKPHPQAIVEISTLDGTQLREHVVHVHGTVGNPMTREDVGIKCKGLLTPVLGEDPSKELIDTIWKLEQVKNMRDLWPLLSEP
jgi:2-methylcitrate dehydratase PrpD